MIDRIKQLLDRDTDLCLMRGGREWWLFRLNTYGYHGNDAHQTMVDHGTDLEEMLSRQGV